MKPINEREQAYRFDDKEHLHFLDDKPLTGTSSVIDVLSKPLTWWASGLAVKEFGCPDPKVLTKIKGKKATSEELSSFQKGASEMLARIQKMSVEEYMKLIDKAYRAHSTTLDKKADEGTDLHTELEKYVKDKMNGSYHSFADYDAKIKPFIEWADKNVKEFLYSEAHCYSRQMWVGGISDAGAILHDGRMALIDFKSAKEAYKSHFIQAAGYAIQIAENGLFTPNGDLIKKLESPFHALIIVPFGGEKVEPVIEEGNKMANYQSGFEAALLLYRLLNN